MSDTVDITIKGCLVKGLRLMPSKFGGFDIYACEKFGPGVQIAFLHQDRLSPEQKQVIFPNGKVYNLTIQWPLKAAPAPKKAEPAFVAPIPDFLKDEKVESKAESPKAESKPESKPSAPFTPNQFQNKILETVLNNGTLFSANAPHILVEALAGSGKTSTLVWLVNELANRNLLTGKRVIYLAFNRSIAEELNEKLVGTGVKAQTTHAFGFQLIKQRFGKDIKPHNGRCAADAFLKAVCDDNGLRYNAESFKMARKTDEYQLRAAVLELVGYVKSWAVFPTYNGVWQFSQEQINLITEFVHVYEIEYPTAMFTESDIVQYATRVIVSNIPEPGGRLVEIDFDDMIYLPNFDTLGIEVPKYDLVMCDEAQDFNMAQQNILEKMIKN